MDALGCKTATSQMWTTLNQIVEFGDTLPSEADVKQALLAAGPARGWKGAAFEAYVDAFARNYGVTIGGIAAKLGPYDEQTWKKALAEMEIGVRVTDVHAALADQIAASQKALDEATSSLGATCTQPEPPVVADLPSTTGPQLAFTLPSANLMPEAVTFANMWDELKTKSGPAVYGARLVLATAYQSCDAAKRAPLNHASPNMKGVSIDAKRNPSNGGLLRHYASLPQLASTHPYIANQRLAKSTCYEVRNTPPIYDFGAKPYTTSSLPRTLNMFRGDGGTGSEVFGTDCSGYVFSALAVGGMRMLTPDPAKPLKATMITGIPAAAFKEPASNGLKCLEKIKIAKGGLIEPGDVVAIKGHVIMIDAVGADPLGLGRLTKAADCNAATIKADDFDFTITQSSPSKGSVGINRYVAKDYLIDESQTFHDGFIQYAVAACRVKFGLSPSLNSPAMSIVRHKKTSDCFEPKAMELTRAECVDSCR